VEIRSTAWSATPDKPQKIFWQVGDLQLENEAMRTLAEKRIILKIPGALNVEVDTPDVIRGENGLIERLDAKVRSFYTEWMKY
jgi:hypothetical protein